MITKSISLILVLVGIIHLLPVTGVFGIERLAKLYGVFIADANMELLMRHRAMLFAIVGGLLIFAAFKPAIQMLAIVFGLISVASFIVLAMPFEPINAQLVRVAKIDIAALILLLVAAGLLGLNPSNPVKT
jgi:hypothetical protein